MISTALESYARPAIHDRAGATGRRPGLVGRAALIGCVLAVCAGSTQAQQAFPYRFRTGWDVAITASGAAMFGVDLVLGREVDPLTPAQIEALDPSMVSAFDRIATRHYSVGARHASDVLLFTMLAAPVSLMVTSPGSQEQALLGAMYGEALFFQSGLVFMLKSLVARTRPFVYNDAPEVSREKKLIVYARRSFPSAHAATTFTSAVFLATVFSELHPNSSARGWVWAGSLAAASATGYLRIRAGQHFPTDVLAGAAIGGLTGWLVPALHRQVTDDGAAPSIQMSIPLLTLPIGRQSRNR
jgi:membrane-associated phospholipid phosphatase